MSGTDARDTMEAAVRRELFGPPPGESRRGRPLELGSGPPHFESWPSTYGMWHDAITGEEILTETEPLRRYGIGVLYPQGTAARGPLPESTAGTPGLPVDDEMRDIDPTGEIGPSQQPDPDSDDFDLSDANSFQPSAMAVSFRIRLAAGHSLEIEVSCACYDRIPVKIAASEREWWLRRPVTMTAQVSAESLLTGSRRLFSIRAEITGQERVRPQLQAYSRPVPGDPDPDCRLVTVVLVNTTKESGSAAALLQARFEVRPQGGARIESYPEVDSPSAPDGEEESIALLYRHKRTFAIGHGCAADWDEPVNGAAGSVRADPLPAYEVPSLTPDVFETSAAGARRPVQVSMAALASGDLEGQHQLEKVVNLYADWVGMRRGEIDQLPERHRPAASRHIDLCDAALRRMRAGQDLLASNENAARAFRLANEAMLFQQVRSRFDLREVKLDKAGLLQVAGAPPEARATGSVGNWRPFQIAFLLASLPDVFDPSSSDRELVDLIFFPTGGGKTEAYLGAAAISMFARRLRDPTDAGTDVLMRYTLRLLTAQQFLRAASLLCVMDDIRSNAPDLGDERFSIGIWLGGATTPNRWEAAKTALSKLRRDSRQENPFLLLRCPWCGAQMGPIAKGSKGQEAVGYVPVGSKVRFICPDRACRFAGSEGLPIHVVDEGIYESRPTLVIGTVDKFAMLAGSSTLGGHRRIPR